METNPKKILIVDDDHNDVEMVQQLLSNTDYISVVVSNGIEVAEMVFKETPDLILLDVNMPGKDGYTIARQLKSHRLTRMIPIIMITALSELESKLEGLEAGADDYITKPYRSAELLGKIRSLLKMKALNDQLDDAENVIFALARMIEAKDLYTLGHASRVSKFAVALGKLLNRTPLELETLDKGGVLHDIGKMAVPDPILLKPGPLTTEEFEIMKTHSLTGYTICERLRSAKDALPLIRHHHEKLDGTGYPDHWKKEEIPLLVRIVNIVDIYDALTTQRSYKNAWPIDKTFSVMYEEVKRGWWDGDLLRIWEKFVLSGEIKTLSL